MILPTPFCIHLPCHLETTKTNLLYQGRQLARAAEAVDRTTRKLRRIRPTSYSREMPTTPPSESLSPYLPRLSGYQVPGRRRQVPQTLSSSCSLKKEYIVLLSDLPGSRCQVVVETAHADKEDNSDDNDDVNNNSNSGDDNGNTNHNNRRSPLLLIEGGAGFFLSLCKF